MSSNSSAPFEKKKTYRGLTREQIDALGPLTFGFDIGIASVGWAVLCDTRIVDLGVRAFDKAETSDKGESLNLARRTARLTRRRLRRRAWRLVKVARALKRHGLIADSKLFLKQPGYIDSVWQLRKAALDRLVTPAEWVRVIYHLCKHRGFHWTSRAEALQAEGDAKSENGKVKQGLAGTAKLMKEKGYRTAAEMVLAEFPDAQRNKRGEYTKALSRVLLALEFSTLFDRQRALGNPNATLELEYDLLGDGNQKSGLFWAQMPSLTGEKLLDMLGTCTFEKGEPRAPKASFTAERHVWLTRLNNLRITVDGVTRPLIDVERSIAIPLPYTRGEKFTYKDLRTALQNAGLSTEFRFAALSYPSLRQREEDKAKDPEAETLTKLSAWHDLRLAFKRASLETIWQQLSTPALDGDPTWLDQIGWTLSVYKDDDEVLDELRKLSLPGGEACIDVLLGVRFDKFHALSLKALLQIVPKMEAGMRFDEAVAAIPAYGHHSQPIARESARTTYLPAFYTHREKDGRLKFNEDLDVPRNPVVLRALNQARKVCNALIKVYGAPHTVNIEMARDLSRPLEERREVLAAQKEFRERNEKAREQFEETFGHKSTGATLEKWMLYREQTGKCAYSLEAFESPDRVINDASYAEIDHVLPYSRSYDDSKNNKVLVLARENRDKGNRTPHEYLTALDGGEHGPRWRSFVGFVDSNKAYRQAKRSRLLRKGFGKDEAKSFMERNLNDTRYICKFFKNYVERFLQLAETSEAKRCVVVSGQLTAFLRARWGLLKIRAESDRHHAMDAAVVAACSHSMVKRLSDYSRRRELSVVSRGFIDLETGEIVDAAMYQQLERHFPEPWSHFRHELEARLKLDDVNQMREQIVMLGSYNEIALDALKPLFVSRAPQRRNGGAAHKETIYAQSEILKETGSVKQRVALSSLALKVADIDKFIEKLVDPHRNAMLYEAIRDRLITYGGKGDKAFAANNLLRKPDKLGEQTGPIVRSVNTLIDKLSGIEVRGGVAKNDTMLRVDVFQNKKDRKFHLVPVYVHHRVAGLPNRAIVQGKDEDAWTVMDDGFDFLFSLHANDLVRVVQRGNVETIGYYRSCHSGTGNLNIAVHDRARYALRSSSLAYSLKNPGKDIPNDKLGLIEGVGVKTAVSVKKFNVDTLGHAYASPLETRRDLA